MFRMILILLALATVVSTAEAQRFRSRRHYTTPTVSKQVGTPSPVSPAQSKPAEVKKSAPARQTFVVPHHHAFGMELTALVEALPEAEAEVLRSISDSEKENARLVMLEKYPEARPEVAETLAEVSQAVAAGDEVQHIGMIVRKLPIAPSRLDKDEVLALNSEIAPAIDPQEAKAIDDLNNFRQRSGLRPCLIDVLLCVVSRGHSNDMRRYGFFSHNSPVAGKNSFTQRASRGGVSASAENIYMGSSSGQAASNAWKNSSGHRANMLGGHSRVGVGRQGGYFTQMFGR